MNRREFIGGTIAGAAAVAAGLPTPVINYSDVLAAGFCMHSDGTMSRFKLLMNDGRFISVSRQAYHDYLNSEIRSR
jgi:hypothetical protein